MSERLSEYRARRDFGRTDEPSGTTEVPSHAGPPRFVIQHHDASSEQLAAVMSDDVMSDDLMSDEG